MLVQFYLCLMIEFFICTSFPKGGWALTRYIMDSDVFGEKDKYLNRSALNFNSSICKEVRQDNNGVGLYFLDTY